MVTNSIRDIVRRERAADMAERLRLASIWAGEHETAQIPEYPPLAFPSRERETAAIFIGVARWEWSP